MSLAGARVGAHLCGNLRLPRAQQHVGQAVADGLVLPGRLHVAQAELDPERSPEVTLQPPKASAVAFPQHQDTERSAGFPCTSRKSLPWSPENSESIKQSSSPFTYE